MTQPTFAAGAAAARRRHLVLGGLAALTLAPLAGCGGGTELLFVPFISFLFRGTGPGNQVVTFSFTTDNPTGCSVSGRFAANSNMSSDADIAAVGGSFNGRRMDITLSPQPAGLAAAYTGQFIDDATVMLSPVGGGTAFNIVRDGLRPASCPASG